MPTLNPRVNVTLSPSLDRLVTRLAGLQDSSKAQVLRDLLEAAEPALQRVVTLMAAAQGASRQVHAGLAEALADGMEALERSVQEDLETADGTPDLVTKVQAVKGRRAGRREASRRATRRPAQGQLVLETPVPLTGGLGRVDQGDGKAVRKPRKVG